MCQNVDKISRSSICQFKGYVNDKFLGTLKLHPSLNV
jgi:hypothetical protein